MKGKQAKGKTFERSFNRWIKRMVDSGELGVVQLHINQWIMGQDTNGDFFAQPDAYLVYPDLIVLFECKLTQTDNAFAQMFELYKPLLEKIYHRPVMGIEVFKNLHHAVGIFISDVEHLKRLINNPSFSPWQFHFPI